MLSVEAKKAFSEKLGVFIPKEKLDKMSLADMIKKDADITKLALDEKVENPEEDSGHENEIDDANEKLDSWEDDMDSLDDDCIIFDESDYEVI